MKNPKHHHPAVAAVAAVSLLLQPTAPLTAAAMRDRQAAPAASAQSAPKAPAQPAPKAAAQPGAKPATAAAAAATTAPVDGGWPRVYDLPSGASMLLYQPQISSWDKQKHLVAFSAVSYRTKSAEKPADRHGQVRGGHQRRRRRAHRRPAEPEDHGSHLPDAAEGSGARDFRRNRQRAPRRRAGHRARSRAGQSRQEPDRAEERRGHQGRSADRSSSARRPR